MWYRLWSVLRLNPRTRLTLISENWPVPVRWSITPATESKFGMTCCESLGSFSLECCECGPAGRPRSFAVGRHRNRLLASSELIQSAADISHRGVPDVQQPPCSTLCLILYCSINTTVLLLFNLPSWRHFCVYFCSEIKTEQPANQNTDSLL